MNHLLVLSQTYPPDPAAVGQHIADVARHMVERGWRVTVYTSRRGYDDPRRRYPWRETLDGVDVRRLPLSSLGKGGILIRLAAQWSFILQAVFSSMFLRRVSAVLVSTSPPFAGFAGCILKSLRGWPFVWWVMDVNPDQMVTSGRARASSSLVRIFDWMNRLTLNAASGIVTLDRFMRDRLLAKAEVGEKMAVISPWSHDIVRDDVPHDANPFRAAHNLGDSFVVMYSGNHGYSTPLDTLLAAAKQLEHEPHLKFVFIGGGVVKAAIDEMVRRTAPPNILSLPYQPLADIRFSLSSADVHVVSLANEGVGIVHPCKIYGALAMGRPVIALAPRDSYVGDILATHRVGWLVEHGEVAELVALLQRLIAMPRNSLAEYGAGAREAASGEFRREKLLDGVCDMVQGVASSACLRAAP
jgi:colanic acid biosynthesis glycosyl transferase WcaI